jgi:hypothetical protein
VEWIKLAQGIARYKVSYFIFDDVIGEEVLV